MKRIALYTRRSIYSEESESINMQIDACKQYFKREECEFEVFIDEGFSGSNTDRPDFIRMRNQIRNNEFDVVVVYKIDRISRNMVDFINLVNDFEQYDVPLISVTEGADPTTSAGKFVMNILASVAEMERANIQQRVTDNMLMIAKNGRWTGGNPPFGYESFKIVNSGTFLKVDESKREIILDIYDRYLECESINETSRYISNKYFSISIASVANTLSSPVYLKSSNRTHEYLKLKGFTVTGEPSGKGYLTYGKRPKVRNLKQWNNTGYIAAVSIHESLIDEDTWFKVQSLIEKNSVDPRPKESIHSYLNQLVVCGICKENMIVDLTYTRVDKTKVYSFRCSGKKKDASSCDNGFIITKELEKSIEDKLKKIGLNKDLLNDYVSFEDEKDYKKQISEIQVRINRNNLQINNLADKLSLLSNEAAKAIISKIEQLTSNNKKLQTELLTFESLQSSQKNSGNDLDSLYDSIHLFNEMDDTDIEGKRAVIRNIIEQIDFTKEGSIAEMQLKA